MPQKIFQGESFRKVADLSSLALMLPSSIAVGLFFGFLLDKAFKTHPWFLLIFFLLGIASGLLSLLRGLSKYSPSDNKTHADKPGSESSVSGTENGGE